MKQWYALYVSLYSYDPFIYKYVITTILTKCTTQTEQEKKTVSDMDATSQGLNCSQMGQNLGYTRELLRHWLAKSINSRHANRFFSTFKGLICFGVSSTLIQCDIFDVCTGNCSSLDILLQLTQRHHCVCNKISVTSSSALHWLKSSLAWTKFMWEQFDDRHTWQNRLASWSSSKSYFTQTTPSLCLLLALYVKTVPPSWSGALIWTFPIIVANT